MNLAVMITLAIILSVCAVIRKSFRYIPFVVLTIIFFCLTQETILPWTHFRGEHRDRVIFIYTTEILSLLLLCISILYIFLMNRKHNLSSFLPLALSTGMIITRIVRYFKVDHILIFTTNDTNELLSQLIYLQAKYRLMFFLSLIIVYGLYFWQLFSAKKQPIEMSST